MVGPGVGAVPAVAGILETALYVEDLDRSRAFYQRLMGFDCFLSDARMCALGVPGRGVLLLFRRHGSKEPSQTPAGTIPAHDGMGLLHLAFAIPADALRPGSCICRHRGSRWKAG